MLVAPTSFSLRHTEEIWKALNEMAVMKGAKDFRSYIHARLHSTAKHIKAIRSLQPDKPIFIDCPDCEKRNNTFVIPEDIAEEIQFIANQYCMPVTAFINMLYVDPLIKEYKSTVNGIIIL